MGLSNTAVVVVWLSVGFAALAMGLLLLRWSERAVRPTAPMIDTHPTSTSTIGPEGSPARDALAG